MISYKVGVYDILRERDLRNLDREIQMSRAEGSNSFGVEIYSEELCDALGINKPLKPLEDRMASTIRHNRARGSHDVNLMVNIVKELTESGMSDAWISIHHHSY